MYLLLFSLLFFLTACQDKSIVKIYEKNLEHTNVTCLRLVVFPPDEKTQTILESIYSFSEECTVTLTVSQKAKIVCNSNQNAAKKTMSNFPSSYLRMDIKSENRPLYSYYVDLLDKADKGDLLDALSRVREDLEL